MNTKVANLQEVKPSSYYDSNVPSSKYQCNQCKFIFYNSNVCPRCGSPDVDMMIID